MFSPEKYYFVVLVSSGHFTCAQHSGNYFNAGNKEASVIYERHLSYAAETISRFLLPYFHSEEKSVCV